MTPRRWAWLRIVFGTNELKEQAMTTELVTQPSKQPIRKVKFGAIASGLLTLIVYVISAQEGEGIVSDEAALDALTALGATLVPLVTAWFTKSAVAEAGE